MSRFLCAVITAISSVAFAEGERAVWTLYSGNDNAHGLNTVTWKAADGVETTTSIDPEADYIVSDNKTIFISSASSAVNIFNGHSLTIGDIANNKAGAIFHYGGKPVTTDPATFMNDGVILSRGDWKTQYEAERVYQVVGMVTVTATSDSPFRMYRSNTGGGVAHGVMFNGPLCGSGYLQVGHGVGSGVNFVLYLAGGCADFSGNVSVASEANKRGALVVTNTTTTGSFSIGAGSDLSMFSDTDVFTAGSLTLAAGSTLKFKASDYTSGTRQVRNNRIALTGAFSAASGVNVKIDFTDSANGKFSDAFDLITVPDSQTLNADDFTFVPTDGLHMTAAFSVRNDTETQTKTLVLTFEGSGLSVLTLKTSSNNTLGIAGATWSDNSIGTSSNYNYVVRDGKVLYISSATNSLNVFNGNLLQLGDGFSAGHLYQYGGFPVLSEIATFGNEGILLVSGAWRPRYSYHYLAAGKIKVTAPAESPFRIFCDYDGTYSGSIASLTWLGPLSGSGALQVDNGLSDKARCNDFSLKIYGGAADFTGRIVVTSQVSNVGVDCRAGLAVTNGALPAAVSIGTKSYLKFPGPGETTTLKSLQLDAGADLIVNASVSVSGEVTNRFTGAVCVTNTFTMTGPVNLKFAISQDGAAGGAFTILTVPYASALVAGDFNLILDADKFLTRGAELSVVEDVGAGVKRLTLTFEESSIVYQTASDLNVTGVILSGTYVSSMTNALHWSDLALPHAGSHYFCDAGRHGNGLVLRTPSDDTSAWTFPGKSLSIIGSSSYGAGFALLHTEFTIPVLRFVGPAEFHSKYELGGVTVHGEINVESGNVTWQSFAGGLFVHDGELTGSANLTLTGNGISSGNPGGYFEFRGINTAFSGKVNLTISSGSGAPSTEIDSSNRRKFETLYLNDGRNLGGAMSPADPQGVSINNCSMIITRKSLAIDEPTRGWHVGYMGRFNVISNDHVMTFKSPLAMYGTLCKEGEGTLVMGNPQPTFGAAGTNTTPDAESTNRQFVVSGGDVRVTSAYALNGMDVVCTNAASTFMLDAETENADLIQYGIIDILTPGTPFAVGGDAATINVAFTCGDEPEWSKKTLAICTVKAAAADAVEALLKGVRIGGSPSAIIESISRQNVTLGDADCVTFKAYVTTGGGMVILLK
ncbi:MAG: hypothetical protein PHV28_04720 [Kiritimatiellae bacterium]|nr:hypothetical protein [Kiritimatiellia bacterium]